MDARDLVDSRPTLVLSPHMDDAILSAFAVCSSVECDVWTVFAGPPEPAQTTTWDTSCGFASSDETIRARRIEDDLAFADLPCRPRRLDAWEGAYATRERQTSDLTLIERELRAWLGTHPRATVIAPIAAGRYLPPNRLERLRDRLRPSPAGPQRSVEAGSQVEHTTPNQPTEASLAPRVPRTGMRRAMDAAVGVTKRPVQAALHVAHQRRRHEAQRGGMAYNPDHLALRDLALNVSSDFPDVRLVLCEDLPYLWHESGDLQAQLLRRRGMTLRVIEAPVNSDAKFAHLQAYTSQLSLLDPAGRLLDAGSIPAVERYWIVEE